MARIIGHGFPHSLPTARVYATKSVTLHVTTNDIMSRQSPPFAAWLGYLFCHLEFGYCLYCVNKIQNYIEASMVSHTEPSLSRQLAWQWKMQMQDFFKRKSEKACVKFKLEALPIFIKYCFRGELLVNQPVLDQNFW